MSSTADFGGDLEAVLADVLRPVDPPERLSDRVEGALSQIATAAATELSDWADEMTAGEREALSDPRNWVRPVVAAAAGGVAGAALIVFGVRHRRGSQDLADRIGEGVGELRERLSSD